MQMFSDRFKILLENAGFDTKRRGLLTDVTQFFEIPKSTAHSWLNADHCPRVPTLEDIVARLIKQRKIPKSIPAADLTLWLEKGNAVVPDPFNPPSKTPHALAGHLYLKVDDEARKLGYKLLELDREMFEAIFSKLSINSNPTLPEIRQVLKAAFKTLSHSPQPPIF